MQRHSFHYTSPARKPHWQAELVDSFTRLDELLAYLEIPFATLDVSRAAAQRFPLRVTRHYAALMNKGDGLDPLLRQVLPIGDELAEFPGFVVDPVGDLAVLKVPGILHKYHGRALLMTTGACAIHCRYCFRQAFPYTDGQLSRQHETKVLEYLAADNSLSEVILSGGDPLVLTDHRLAELLERLARIRHLERLRIHTRLPIVLPSRITEELCALLHATRLRVVVVIHANHPRELLGIGTESALGTLRGAGVTLLNQSVLLRGVNDDVAVLAELSQKLFEYGVLPYYLHRLDKARGTAHFDLTDTEVRTLYRGLRSRLPGYLVPRLVSEEAGLPYKTLQV